VAAAAAAALCLDSTQARSDRLLGGWLVGLLSHSGRAAQTDLLAVHRRRIAQKELGVLLDLRRYLIGHGIPCGTVSHARRAPCA
jgi:hypothetical protein